MGELTSGPWTSDPAFNDVRREVRYIFSRPCWRVDFGLDAADSETQREAIAHLTLANEFETQLSLLLNIEPN